MNIIVNGIGETIDSPKNLFVFLKEKEINHKNVVIEHNGVILRDCDFQETLLSDDDRLEILRILGGG